MELHRDGTYSGTEELRSLLEADADDPASWCDANAANPHPDQLVCNEHCRTTNGESSEDEEVLPLLHVSEWAVHRMSLVACSASLRCSIKKLRYLGSRSRVGCEHLRQEAENVLFL